MALLTRQKVHFGPFELDPSSGELFKLGYKLNLRGQPIEVLSILLERPGEVVTREELCKRLWPQDTFVDFEHSLNTAIKKLRQALDDDVEAPRYIETLPKKGYRFIAQIEPVSSDVRVITEPANSFIPELTESSPPKQSTPKQGLSVPKPRRQTLIMVALVAVVALGCAAYWILRPRTPVVTRIYQLTHTGRHKSSVGVHSIVTDGMRVYFDEFDGTRWHIAEVRQRAEMCPIWIYP